MTSTIVYQKRLLSLCRMIVLCFGSILMISATPPPSVIRDIDEFEFTYRVTLPDISAGGHLWIPLARSDSFQTARIQDISAPVTWKQIRDQNHGNQALVFALSPKESGKVVQIDYHVRRLEKTAYPSYDKEDVLQYLRPERLVPVNQTFKSIAEGVIDEKSNVLEQARALYMHVLEKMRYDKTGKGWGRGDAVYACTSGTGNCTDFHSYFIALARAVGIPARFAIGATIPADKNEGKIAGYHCWAEFLANEKWIPVDISEAWKEPSLADYYFGNHPANRFELSVGRDLAFDLKPSSDPFNFLAYAILEIEGKEVPVQTEFAFRRMRK